MTVGPYKPIAEFIKLARQLKVDAAFVAISFVGSDSLAQELGNQGAGVIISQVVPFPGDKSLPVVAAYQAALTAVNSKSKPGFVSLEGYLVGQLVVEALKRIPGEPTREAFLDAIEGAPFDLGGVTLAFRSHAKPGIEPGLFHRDSERRIAQAGHQTRQDIGTVTTHGHQRICGPSWLKSSPAPGRQGARKAGWLSTIRGRLYLAFGFAAALTIIGASVGLL